MRCRLAGHGHEEGERDEAVNEREQEIRCYGCDVAPEYQVVENQRGMPFGSQVFHVDGQEECEGEERNDDQVNQSYTDGRRGNWRTEWPKVVERELNAWGYSLGRYV